VQKSELEAVQAAVADGVRSAIADPKTWELGFSAMREQLGIAAERESGKWALGWLKWLMNKLLIGAVVLAVLWLTGGLPAVLAYLKVKQ